MQKRDQAVLAALVIGLLIGAAATYVLAGASLSRTATTPTTLAPVTITSTTTVAATASSVQLHKVTFDETGGCSASYYFERWYVTMDNITLVQPSNVTLSQMNNQTGGRSGQEYKEISTIVFTVPDGNYSYYASNGAGEFGAIQRFVVVNGSDKVVPLMTGPYCP
jgi:hypothetical protein